MSILDAKSGKTKKRVSKLTPLFKTCIAYSVSDNGAFLVGILATSGDIFVWTRDAETLRLVAGMSEFALKLGFNVSSIFVSDDASKLLVITCRNRVFVWEKEVTTSSSSDCTGNWSEIVASQEIKTVEDNKELSLHARFNLNQVREEKNIYIFKTDSKCLQCLFVCLFEVRGSNGDLLFLV